MHIVIQPYLTELQKQLVFQLWNEEYPQKLSYSSITEFDGYLNQLFNKTHYLLLDNDQVIKGWGCSFKRDDEKWFAIILNSGVQNSGYGTMLLNKLKEQENRLSGWVIDHAHDIKTNGSKYQSPLGFYLKNNFIIHTGTRIESEKISAVKIGWIKD